MSKDYDAIFEWLKNEGNLPAFLKDFHDQKDIFKGMHELYEKDFKERPNMPSWADAHVYIVDFFLWYMGSRGYTLQKSRKKFDFLEFAMPTKAKDLLKSMLQKSNTNKGSK